MSFEIWEPAHLCPIAFLLTTYGSRENKLLFRYPSSKHKPLYESPDKSTNHEPERSHKISKSWSSNQLNKFSYQSFDEVLNRTPSSQDNMIDSIDRLKTTSYIENNKLSTELKEELLVNLLAVMNNSSEYRFFLKLEDIIFVGHSCGSSKFNTGVPDENQTIRTFNVVFVLKSTAPKVVQDSFYSLSKSIASAICMEEKRCLFLNNERLIIQNLSDELQEHVDDGNDPLTILLEKSQLCRDLKKIVDEVCQTGVVMSKINNMVTVCQSIPQRMYNIIDNVYVSSKDLLNAANKIRPYHTLIFLSNKEDVVKYSPIFNPDFKRFANAVSIRESIFMASKKSYLQLNFCLKMAANLVLWNKAIICYPIQDSNLYTIAPFINVITDSLLLERFHDNFPLLFLPKVFIQIDGSRTYSDICCNLMVDEEMGLQLFEWLLINRVIYQVHKYYFFAQGSKRDSVEFGKTNNFPILKSKSIDEDNGNLLTQMREMIPVLFTDDDMNIEQSLEPESIKLFFKIKPLCNGEHHLEEIAYQIGERPSDIVRVFDQFSSLIITVETSDPVTSCFVGIV